MKKPFFAFLLATALLPFAAVSAIAQTPPGGDGPPPAVRAQILQIRATAKTNAFNALSQDHRDRVNAIVSQVDAGTLDRQTAVQQIDAILTPSEAQAVLAQNQTMRDAMRKIFEQNAPAGGDNRMGPPGGGGFGGQQGARRTPDAGRVLLMLSAQRRRPPSQQQPQ